jgi:hypothetical protein
MSVNLSEMSSDMRVTLSKDPSTTSQMEVDVEDNNGNKINLTCLYLPLNFCHFIETLDSGVGTELPSKTNTTDSQEISPQIPSTSTTSISTNEENSNEQMPRRRRKGENRHIFFGLPVQNYPDPLLPFSDDAQLAEAIPNGTGSGTSAQNQEIQNPQDGIVNETQYNGNITTKHFIFKFVTN